MRKIAFILIWILLGIGTLSGQNLPRRGSLGVSVDNAPQTFFDRYGWATTKGVVLTQVIPASSADRMGLKSGDVIVDVNGVVVTDVQSFYSSISKLKPRESLKLKVLRRSVSEEIMGELTGKFDENSPDGQVIYDELQVDFGYLRSIVHKPVGDGKFPAIYYLPDYACTSLDFSTNDEHPVKQMIDGWVSAGYVVYRLEKPGVGDSDGAKKCETIGFEDEVNLYLQGLKQLKKYAYVDSSKVFLFGHAFGGITAPVLASKSNVKGIMVYGTVLKPWIEYLTTYFRNRSIYKGDDPLRTDDEMRKLMPVMVDWLMNGKSAREIAGNEAYKNFLLKTDNPLRYQGSTFMGRHSSYFYEVQQKVMVQVWKNLNVSVLSMHGELDINAPDAKDAQSIVEIVNNYHSGKGKFLEFPQTEQNFVTVPGLKEYVSMVKSEGFTTDYMGKNFNGEVLGASLKWMKEVLANP